MTTDSAHHLPVVPNLLNSRFDGWQPDQVWMADITYVPTGEGWLHLAAVMDLVGRRILGWSMSEAIDAALVCAALIGLVAAQAERAWRRSWGHDVHEQEGNAWDNPPLVSFFRTLRHTGPGQTGNRPLEQG